MDSFTYDGIDRDGRPMYRYLVPTDKINNVDYWKEMLSSIKVFFDSIQPNEGEVSSKPIPEVHILFHVPLVTARIGELIYDAEGGMVWISKFVDRKSFTRCTDAASIDQFKVKTFKRFHRDLKVFYEMNGIPTRF